MSLGRQLFQKIKWPYLSCFLLALLINYFQSLVRFNIRNNFNKRSFGYGKFNWIFWQQNFRPQQNIQWYKTLLLILLLCFLVGAFLFEIINYWLKNYCFYLGKNWLRQLIILRCFQILPAKVKKNQEAINEAIFNYAPRWTTSLINLYLEIFANLVGMALEIYFLWLFLGNRYLEPQIKKLALWFNSLIILAFVFYILLVFSFQKKQKKRWEQRQQAESKQIWATLNSLAVDNKIQQQANIQKMDQLLAQNFQKNKSFWWQKSLFGLPFLLIPGLSVFFYFLYYNFAATSFEGAFEVYFLSLNIQNIFWKLKRLLQQIPNYQETNILYFKLTNTLKKLD